MTLKDKLAALVCSAHAEVIPFVIGYKGMLDRLLRTRGGNPIVGAFLLFRGLSAPHTRR